MIGVELAAAMPWHPRPLQHIRMPDPRYGKKAWPELVPAPVILVEAGFDVDPLFSAWIRDEQNQREYGRAVARATVSWAAKYCDNHKKKEVL